MSTELATPSAFMSNIHLKGLSSFKCMPKKVLAIDIGYFNMGLVFAEGTHPTFVKKVSLEDYKYIYSNDIVDLVPLMVDDHRRWFDEAEHILIERQPPGGFQNIEVLLHYMFRDKVTLVNPVSLHTHFGIRHLTYEERKERTTSIAEKYIEGGIPYERKHDIGDAMCMIVYFDFRTTVHIFDKFRFTQTSTVGQSASSFRSS